jgi:hypothetical protein
MSVLCKEDAGVPQLLESDDGGARSAKQTFGYAPLNPRAEKLV